ncbi:hypothetical protein HMPREF9237_00682 [Actinotignum schaalii FB123-CNA-2]|uniref:Uncharacterized protein n=1 Tax=Actinotignum schaalii FB123-CNA-2 TaxID=883067 RepID=S2WHG7_9ACTO|nr:hypothetical protein HMPREF9237_00682 [Actinotignum schaalii FB123-CNA-2]
MAQTRDVIARGVIDEKTISGKEIIA